VVKGVQFLGLRDAGDPVEVARAYEIQQADELVFLDITASFQQRKTLVELVLKIAENIFMPFTVGGGISSVDDIRVLLNAGADKISINTSAVKDPGLITASSARFGSQCIVVAIDAKRSAAGSWEVYTHGGRTATGQDAVAWAQQAASLGAGEILLTSMDCDGTKNGYDLELTKRISETVDIPVIASGGAGIPEHFYDVVVTAGADACLAASLFHYNELTVRQVKDYLLSRGVAVRI
jgi:imidazole glycerol-phosphate synthase subunit HisF